MQLFDKDFKAESVSILFNETITSDKKNSFGILSPINGCVRHQFLCYMIKVAANKYKIYPKKQNITFKQCQEMLVAEFEEKFEAFDQNIWRWDR